MHRRVLSLLAILFVCAGGLSPRMAPAQSASHPITSRQAHQIAALVARHDDIDLADTHIELNSMDLGREFAPGFYSFILIRESTSPGPDQTLRQYAINRRTGDVWEMNLCTHYDFPELKHMQRSFSGHSVGDAADLSAQSRHLGCSKKEAAPTS
jgi:hypothetical protein